MEKKAHKLEDQLAAAKAALAEATRAFEAKKSIVAEELEETEARHRIADQDVDDAWKSLSKVRNEAVSRLGLTPARVRKAVLRWAGLANGEEGQAIVRGSDDTLKAAVKAFIERTIDADPDARAAQAVCAAAQARRRPLNEKIAKLRYTYWQEERTVTRCMHAVEEVEQKLRSRNAERHLRKIDTEAKPPSKEDQTRFVEARRRLAIASDHRDRKGQELAKLPKFVWPPTE